MALLSQHMPPLSLSRCWEAALLPLTVVGRGRRKKCQAARAQQTTGVPGRLAARAAAPAGGACRQRHPQGISPLTIQLFATKALFPAALRQPQL